MREGCRWARGLKVPFYLGDWGVCAHNSGFLAKLSRRPMLFLLSPAKALDYDTPAGDVPHTQPLFVKQSAELIDLLQEKSPQDIASLMHLSDALASQ